MISHFVVDDKFIDIAYETFEEVNPGGNRYILLSFTKKLKYIKKTPVEIINPLRYFFSVLFQGRREKFSIFHWMDYKKILLLTVLDKKAVGKIMWIGWGADYYYYFSSFESLLLDKTREIFFHRTSNLSFFNGFKLIFIERLKSLFRVLFLKYGIKKIDYFSPVLKKDYDKFKASLSEKLPPYIAWNYGNLEDFWISGLEVHSEGENILLGNSSAIENNHADALEVLSSCDLQGRKIICPLSYGDEYVKPEIKTLGQEKFGDSFITLESFLPLSEYNQIISSCSVVIMNHLRQQGLGNILTMLYSGARIYLQKDNPIFPSLKEAGAILFEMSELNIENKDRFKRLTMEEIAHNREVLVRFIGKIEMQAKTKNLISVLISERGSNSVNQTQILLLAPQKSPWIKRDYDILKGSFDTSIKYILSYKDVFKVLPAVLTADCLYLWFGSLKFLLPVALAKMLNKKVVIVCGGFEVAAVEEINYGAFCSKKPKLLKLMRKLMLSSADKILCVSESNYEQSVEVAKIPKVKCQVVPLFVEDHQTPIKDMNYKKKQVILIANIYSKESYICKGVDIFLEVARKMPDFNFIIMGSFAKHLIPKELPINVELTGSKDYLSHEFIHLVQSSIVAIQPSRHESFCSSIVEAATLGTFPIGSNNFALRNVIPKIGGKVSGDNSPESYVEIINSIYANGYAPLDISQRALSSYTFEMRQDGILNEIKRFS